ncbi:hypothetical protein ACFH04_29045 [Streptomyces noboritoensis]|uniref:Uncharacterized protein n=1 Tax=Streptomyces noboritoensis TaxID=67337 RepID=A0ABV6TPM6_9ACTN
MTSRRFAVDKSTDAVGEIVAEYEGSVYLRPPGGGTEWSAPPHQVRPCTEAELRDAQALSRPVVTFPWA